MQVCLYRGGLCIICCVSTLSQKSSEGGSGGDLHEEEPHDLTVGISIQGLVKVYDDVS